eukprot:3689156-Rhodomonas_salina.3
MAPSEGSGTRAGETQHRASASARKTHTATAAGTSSTTPHAAWALINGWSHVSRKKRIEVAAVPVIQ